MSGEITFGNTYKSIRVRRGLRADLPILKDGEMGFCVDTKELAVGHHGTNYFFATGSQGVTLYGSDLTPVSIEPAIGVPSVGNAFDELHMITGRAGQGAEYVTAAKQVPSGISFGRMVRLVGNSDVDFPIFQNGNGLRLNGEWRAEANRVLTLICLGANQDYLELDRN